MKTKSVFSAMLGAAACSLLIASAPNASANIGGTVFCDSNLNGVLDTGEPGIPGVTVMLCDGTTTTTDANGNYNFDSINDPNWPPSFPCSVTVIPATVQGSCNVPECPTTLTAQAYGPNFNFCFIPQPEPRTVSGVVSCPSGSSAAGIRVFITGVGSTTTSGNGAYSLDLPAGVSTSYSICVDPSTLPTGATVGGCTTFSVDDDNPFANVDFTLGGNFCSAPPPPPSGLCWLTGGGTVDKTKGKPTYSYGGVVNPGCSPTAADGGNWNVIAHVLGLHFQGQAITVDNCSGVSTRSPRVNVNIIDFHGTGIITGVGGNPFPKTPVTFVARAIDNLEPGAGKDMLYLKVSDLSANVLLQIGNSMDDPEVISTGNLQIHTSSCGN